MVDGETGFVVDPDDVTLLAQTLERLVVDPPLRAAHGRGGAGSGRSECSYDARVAWLAPLAAGDLGVLRPL